MNTYSQSGQDLFALKSCGGKTNGTFIDIGCAEPIANSNTYALEEIGWRGLCIDMLPFDYSQRKAHYIQGDARAIMPEIFDFVMRHGGDIDYLSLDADDATLEIMLMLPMYKVFRAITIEHDSYRVGPGPKKQIFDYLSSQGYNLAAEDVKAPLDIGAPWCGQPYEDWYVRK
jgi:hypothetical protein